MGGCLYYTAAARRLQYIEEFIMFERAFSDLELWPSVYEVLEAERVFLRSIAKYKEDISNGTMQPKTAVNCALAEVWRHGRLWQKEHTDRPLQGVNRNPWKNQAMCGKAADCT